MNATEYKTVCQQPDILGRFVIEETARHMPTGSRLKSQLHTVLNQEPIQKPVLYEGDINNDHFKVDLTAIEAEEIADILFSLEAKAVSPSGKITSCAYSIAGLVDIWHNYIEAKDDA